MKRRNYPKLSVDELRKLKWSMVSHMNGGSSFSSMSYRNKKHGLLLGWTTNGSPKYEIQSKDIRYEDDPENEDFKADLLADDLEAELERFVKQYNDRQLGVI